MEMRGAVGAWLRDAATWWAPRPHRAAEAWQDFAAVLAWLLGLQLLDLLTTLGALAHGAEEGNPFAAALLEARGPAALVQLKVVALVLALGWLPAFALVQRGRNAAAVAGFLGVLVALALLYSGVVVHNLAVLSARLGA